MLACRQQIAQPLHLTRVPKTGAAQAALLQDRAATWVGSAARQARARTPPLDGAGQNPSPGARRLLAPPSAPAAAGAGGAGGGPGGAGADAGERKAPSTVLQATAADAAAAAGEQLAQSGFFIALAEAQAMWAIICLGHR